MKTIILLFALVAIGTSAKSQKCWLANNRSESDEPNVTVGVLIDWSLKPLGRTGFTGLGVSVGMWAGSQPNWPNIGIFAGYIESKLNDSTLATREGAVTIAARLFLFDKKIQVVPSFAAGTHNYQDYALRVGYKINDGIYLGVMGGRMQHYGFSVTMSIFQ